MGRAASVRTKRTDSHGCSGSSADFATLADEKTPCIVLQRFAPATLASGDKQAMHVALRSRDKWAAVCCAAFVCCAALMCGLVGLPGALAQDLPAGVGIATTAKGKVLTDARGMTLYVFDGDKGGTSSCYGTCAETWPPLKVDQSVRPAAGFAVVTRKDGSHQLSYKGHPLYTWHKDRAPGDIDGDGFRDSWHLAKP